MSWILGLSGNGNQNNVELNDFVQHSEIKYRVYLPSFKLLMGGVDETCLFETTPGTEEKGWAVVGIGIQVTETVSRFLGKEEWREILSEADPKIDKLDGHFIAMRWDKDTVDIFTDQLGLRTFYFSKSDGLVCFSTRLDWVSQLLKLNELNHSAVGSRWLLFNQMSPTSCIKGINRSGASSQVQIIKDNIVVNKNNPWTPEIKRCHNTDVTNILKSLINLPTHNNDLLTLALSGGIDSRTILSILINKKDIKFNVHTFGHPSDPDVVVAKRIASDFKLNLQYLNDPLPKSASLLKLAYNFTAQNLLVEPASSILRLRFYTNLYSSGHIIIDGGFGELSRRQYLNRLIRLGKSALSSLDVDKILPYLYTSRADIFNEDFFKILHEGARFDLETTLAEMPSILDLGLENFVDLLSIRTRVPNFGGPEQSRSDIQILNFMPLAQPTYLKALFGVNIHERRNGFLFRNIIRTHCDRLQYYPLVKSGTTYPYGIPTIPALLYTKIKNRIIQPFHDPQPNQFLFALKEYVLDLLHSTSVKQWEGYNYKNILSKVLEYYDGEFKLQSFVDWWLTFEMWRQSINKQSY